MDDAVEMNHLQNDPLRSVVGTFASLRATEAALERIAGSAFPIEQVSVVAKELESEKRHGYITTGRLGLDRLGAGHIMDRVPVRGAGTWLGGCFGLLIGAAFVWPPGFGSLVVAGPFAATLVGELGGESRCTLLSGLAGWGVSARHIPPYEDALRRGRVLLIAHGTLPQVTQAHSLLKDTDAAQLDAHGSETAQGERKPGEATGHNRSW